MNDDSFQQPDISEAAAAVSGTMGEGRSMSAGFSRASRSTVGATGIAVDGVSAVVDGFLGPLKFGKKLFT